MEGVRNLNYSSGRNKSEKILKQKVVNKKEKTRKREIKQEKKKKRPGKHKQKPTSYSLLTLFKIQCELEVFWFETAKLHTCRHRLYLGKAQPDKGLNIDKLLFPFQTVEKETRQQNHKLYSCKLSLFLTTVWSNTF